MYYTHLQLSLILKLLFEFVREKREREREREREFMVQVLRIRNAELSIIGSEREKDNLILLLNVLYEMLKCFLLC